MGARKLKRSVYVYDPKDGRSVTLRAGDTVPSHLRSEITNPDVYEDAGDDTPEGFGEVEQSGPYVGLSRPQMVEIAKARGLKVPDGATTGEVLELVTGADASYAKAAADADKKAAAEVAEAEKKAAADAKAKAAAPKPQA